MRDRLLGIKSLEETEPVELEEVDESLAPQLPAEYEEHLDNHHEDFWRLDPLTNFDPDGRELDETPELEGIDGDS